MPEAQRVDRTARLSMRITPRVKTALRNLRDYLGQEGLGRVSESELVEFLYSTPHHYREDPATLAAALVEWRKTRKV